MSTPDASSIDELLASRQWIRALARNLLSEPADAEDAAQEALAAALEQPPGSIRRLRPWLARVVANFARKQLRGDAHRRAREDAVAAPGADGATGGPGEALERVSIQRDVIEAVLGLEEASRSAILLRYFDELGTAEIAAKLGLCEDAVRQRLRRGRERLREVLRARHAGDERRWTASLLALVAEPRARITPSAASAAEPAGLGLGTSARVAWLALGLVAAATAVWWFRAHRPAPPAGPGATGAASAAAPAGPAAAAAAPVEPAADPGAERRASSAPGSLAVRVRWSEDREPVAGAVVLVRLMQSDLPFPDDRVAATDAQGLARLPDLPPGEARIGLLRTGDEYRWVELRAAHETRVELEIPPGITVAGSVVDASGRGLAGAEIWVSEGWQSVRGQVLARTDERGAFRLRGVQPDGLNWLGARAAGHAPSPVRSFEGLEPGAEVELRIALERRGAALRGRVVDAEGRPIAGAGILIGRESDEQARSPLGSPPQSAASDADGAFGWLGLPSGSLPIQARARGYGAHRAQVELAAGELRELALALEREARVSGRARGADGRPLAGVEIASGEPGSFSSSSTRTDADGRFELGGLGRGSVELRAADGERRRDRTALELRPGARATWNPVLRPAPAIFGTLRDGRGNPVGQQELVLFAGAGAEWTERVAARWATTDGQGRFSFDDVPPRAHTLLAGGAGFDFPGVVARDVRPALEGLELRLPEDAAGTFRVAVLEPGGAPAPRAELCLIERASGHLECFRSESSASAIEVRAPAGTYALENRSEAHPRLSLGERTLRSGQVVDLGPLELSAAQFVRGSILGGAEEALSALALEWTDADGRVLGPTARDGRAFRSPPLAPGACMLRVRGDFAVSREEHLTVEAGRDLLHDVELRPAGLRRVAFEFPAETERPVWLSCEARDAAGATVWASRSACPPSGELELRVSAPPGTYRLSARADNGLRAERELAIEGLDGAQPPLRVALGRE